MITILPSGDSRRQKFDSIEAQIAELALQRAALAGANLPPDELSERCAEVERNLRAPLANLKSRLRQLTKPGPIPALAQKDDDARDQKALDLYTRPAGEYAEELFKALSSEADYAPGPSATERRRRIAEIDAALSEQRIAHEIEACRLEADGTVFVMRAPIAALDIDALLAAWDQAADPQLLERIAAIPEYKGKPDDGAPPWMQGERGEAP